MTDFKKKMIAGLLGGMMILTGGQALANPPEHNKAPQAQEVADIDAWVKSVSERYDVDAAQVKQALDDGAFYEEIKHAAVLSKLSGKSLSEVLAMRVDWKQVAEKLGVTREQLEEFYQQEREEHFAKQAGIDVKTLRSLLKDGYDMRDIGIAGQIAKASGKNIKSVLDKRKINNTWEDVAKSFGVNMKTIMPPPPPGHPHR